MKLNCQFQKIYLQISRFQNRNINRGIQNFNLILIITDVTEGFPSNSSLSQIRCLYNLGQVRNLILKSAAMPVSSDGEEG